MVHSNGIYALSHRQLFVPRTREDGRQCLCAYRQEYYVYRQTIKRTNERNFAQYVYCIFSIPHNSQPNVRFRVALLCVHGSLFVGLFVTFFRSFSLSCHFHRLFWI